ncbi:EamA family transporter [Streptomyces sp. 110]|uniref:EamA family transporter n=1 Tax=Streptomyces endocoffeicus TaxID=2898945 RepID=A0ABS1Q391_9ACTN|nr:EamA family transporter [Streptomyces endocoffeicus]MBL1118421.1 EamA family transporter [Streptomyces endocoffeicus]
MDAPRTGYAGTAAAVTAAALWGLGGTVAGQLFQHGADPLEVVAIRTWVTLLGLGILLAMRRNQHDRLKARPSLSASLRGSWLLVIGFGLSVAVSNATLFLSIDRLPVAVALVLQNLAPAFVVGWQLLASRRPPGAMTVVGLLAALAGVALVVQLPTSPLGDLDLAGIGLGLLTAMGVATFSLLSAQAARACGALTANAGAFAVGSAVWLLVRIPAGVPDLFDRPVLLAGAAGIGIFGTLVPFLLFAWATARVGPQAGAVNVSLEPLFGALLAWYWLGQTVTAVQILGAVVLMAAVVYLQRSPGAGWPLAGHRRRSRSTAVVRLGRPGEAAPEPPDTLASKRLGLVRRST